ncbi:hypothetical protein HCUR_00139 [Holospora curviuscula]|uniref:Uncharacterized protein n=1 Tax=Holospora curviuscula TaxID=1082868 RepID=A0A2S5RGA2_9PROT|nr:hypothetical protein HCUR_00139 [Holospora curviuscula]
MPFFLEAENLSPIRSPVNSLSYCAKESRTLSINLPMEREVLKDWVTATKTTWCLSNSSTILEKSIRERDKRSIL